MVESAILNLSCFISHKVSPAFMDSMRNLRTFSLSKIPIFEKCMLEIVDSIFAPRQLMKQLLLAVGLQGGVFVLQWLGNIGHYVLALCSAKGRMMLKLTQQLGSAKNYQEWRCIAEQVDNVTGADVWRQKDESRLYDCRVLSKRTNDIRWMINHGDVFNLMFRIRGGLARDMYGMQHEGLFSRAKAGTKLLVEDYHDTVAAALNYICDSESVQEDEEIPKDAKLAFFNETRHAYGRTALLLSGGASLGYYHMGLAMELFEQGLLPRVISGASAGSLMAAMLGTRTDEELEFIRAEHFRKDYLRFGWEGGHSASGAKLRFQYMFPQSLRWLGDLLFSCVMDNKSVLKLDTEHLKEVVIANTGLHTFQEAFDRTGRIINITVAPTNLYDPPRLLNYLTAPHICVWSAAVASCAIPGVFDAVPLMVKEPNGEFRPENEWTRGGPGSDDDNSYSKAHHHYSDGSIENDLPMQQLSELFNVNHFIVSQVNPHSALFSTLSVEATVWSHPLYGLVVGILRFLKAQCRDWVRGLTDLLVYRALAPSWSARRGVSQLLTQEYGGRESDITIMPWRGHLSVLTAFTAFLKNPSEEEYQRIVHVSKGNTWPYISRIKAHCMVEVALDQCVQRLRKRLSHEDSTHKSKSSAPGRVPSFYTSRSIVNLSGLSVADPLPGEENDLSVADNMPAMVRARKSGSKECLTRENGLGTTTTCPYVGAGAPDLSLADDAAGPPDEDEVCGAGDWYNISAVATEEPLSQGKKIRREDSGPLFHRSASGTAVADMPKFYAGENAPSRNKSADNLSGERERRPAVAKTTSMANFYYKHSSQ